MKQKIDLDRPSKRVCGKCKVPAYKFVSTLIRMFFSRSGGFGRWRQTKQVTEERLPGTMSITIRLGKTQHTMLLCSSCAAVSMDELLSRYGSEESNQAFLEAWAADLKAKTPEPDAAVEAAVEAL